MTTNPLGLPSPIARALLAKAWQESRARFFAALALLTGLLIYAVFTSPGFLARYNAHHPLHPLTYSVYVWSGLFHYALQGLWILAAFVLALGGLARERATGAALFTLALPVRRLHLFLVRATLAAVESILLGLVSALLIPLLSKLVNESYPPLQAFIFGAWMSLAGLAITTFGLLLSELFEGEFTAPVLGLCSITAIFFSDKAHVLPGWSFFDTMSAAAAIDPTTQLLHTGMPWPGLAVSLALAAALLLATAIVLRTRDF